MDLILCSIRSYCVYIFAIRTVCMLIMKCASPHFLGGGQSAQKAQRSLGEGLRVFPWVRSPFIKVSLQRKRRYRVEAAETQLKGHWSGVV